MGLRLTMCRLDLKRLQRWVSLGAMAVLTVLTMVALPSQGAIAEGSLEYKVKAAFLYKFIAYVDWPATAFSSSTSPFSICLTDSNEQFNATLKKMASGGNVNGHPIVIQQITPEENEADCHILYLGASDPQRATEVAEAVRGANVLTVSNSAPQGIIDFVIADNRVRFNIDDEAAAQNGLVISSKLLSLAVNVKRRESKGGQ